MTKSGQSSRWTGTGAAAGPWPLDAGSGCGARFDSSAFMRFTATRVSPRAVASV